MGMYREKKPVMIEANQFLASKESFDKITAMGVKWYPGPGGTDTFIIETLEGYFNVSKYDYVIKGIKGEFYPCKPDIFKDTYEQISI